MPVVPGLPRSRRRALKRRPSPAGLFKKLPREVAILSSVSFTVALGYGIVAPSIPAFARQFGVSTTAAASVISAFALMRIAGALPAGRLVDRFGERRTMAVGIIIVAVSSAVAGLSGSFAQLLVLRGAGGIGSAMFGVSAQTLLLRSVQADQRGRASGLYSGGFLLGSISGPAIGGLVAAWSLRAPFFIYGAMLIVPAAIAFTVLRDRPPPATEAGRSEIGKPEIGLSEIGLSEMGSPEVGLPLTKPPKPEPSEIGISETGGSGRGASRPGASRPEWRRRDRRDRAERRREGRDRPERGRPERGRADRGRADRGRAERDRAERDRADRGRADRGRADRGRADRGRAGRLAGEVGQVLRSRAYQAAAAANLADGFAVLGVRSAIVPLFVHYVLHRSPTWTGIGFGIVAALNAATLLPAGWAADRLGRRPVIVAGCLTSAGGLLVLAFVPGLGGFLAAMAVLGVGSGLLDVAPSAMIGDLLGQASGTKADGGRLTGEQPDSGQSDSGQSDSGQPDSGPADSGPADSGPADSGPADSGPADSEARSGGAVVASYQMSGDIGAVTGPIAVGFLVDSASYDAAFGLAAGILGLAAIVGLAAPETRKRPAATDRQRAGTDDGKVRRADLRS
jgi:MFS family permease